MKKIILFIAVLMAGTSCNTLDVPPYNIIQDDQIFNAESGVEAYMASIYSDLPIEDFNFNVNGFNQYYTLPALANMTGEMLNCMSDMYWGSPNGDMLQMWQYDKVRKTNYFLQEFEKYKDNFPESQSNMWLGEAHFCRAYYYFAMTKRYGAVPLVKEALNYPETSLEELQISRNSEKESWEFVESELNQAIELLPESSKRGRANKYVALALKSRAMLYAASSAQHATIPSGYENLLGIPKSEATYYYQACYDAADQLKAKYSLYRKYEDKAENYWRLFLDDDSEETIFVRNYLYPDKTHSFDAVHVPYQLRGAHGYSSRFCPTLEFVQMFDDVNGEPFVMKTTDASGKPIRFDNRMDIFKDIEPRLRGSVILPGDVFKGEVIDVQKGLYTSYPDGELKTSASPGAVDADGVSINGRSGMGPNETTSTGFFIRKFQNPDMQQGMLLNWNSEQDWIDFRYAEILLNKAEAAFYLGKKAEALTAINEIRDRAGAKLLTESQLTEDAIRKERRMELAFENQTYWDLRRWRIADKLMDNTRYHALCPYYIKDEGKYIYQVEEVGGLYTYDVKANYVKVPDSEIQKNPNLLPNNPGY